MFTIAFFLRYVFSNVGQNDSDEIQLENVYHQFNKIRLQYILKVESTRPV